MNDEVEDGKRNDASAVQITLRPIDAVGQLGAAPVTMPVACSAAQDPASATLSNFDWMDTLIDEVVEASVRKHASVTRQSSALANAPIRHTEFADLGTSREATSVLGQVVLGYSPIMEPARGVFGTRLTVTPLRAASAIDAGALLHAIGEVWPADGGIVSLNIASETLLRDLLRARPAANMMIEVPAFVAADPANSDALLELAARDCALLLKGRPLRELPRLVLPCFKWSIVDLADERRTSGAEAPRGVTRTIPHIQSGVRTMAELRRSFALGAVAVIGWPLHEPIGDAAEARPDPSVVHAAIQHIDEDPSAKSVDHVLMRDPVLAFELLRHVNAADALSIETGSLRHAVSMMGQANLRRWLVRMLSRGADGSSLRPVNFAALRRGLLMRMLAVGTGQPEARGELFMCGVLSLLDRIYARPMGELVRSLTLPEGVRAALVDRSGPYFPLLKLARTIEAEVPHDIREAADAAFIPPAEINRALLRSLLVASQLERPTAAPVGRHVDGARAPAAPMHT